MHGLAPSTVSIHLHFGGCFAKGCEEFRLAYYGADKPNDYDHALAVGAEAILREWGEYENDDTGNKTLENCLLALDAYFTKFHPATDHIQPFRRANGEPAVEFTFALPVDEVLHPITGEPLLYCGRFDLLGVFNGQLFVVDEKTTSRLGASWINQWSMRGQFLGYVWAAQQFDLPVAGAIARGTSILKHDFGFAESINPFPQWKIDRWRQQLAIDLQQAVDSWNRGVWSQNFGDTCGQYSGCSFKRLCETPDPQRWVNTYYVERFWNPLAADPTAPTNENP